MSITYPHNTSLKRKRYIQKKRKNLIYIRLLLLLFISLVIFSLYSLHKTYVSHKCRNLTYAVDYYFTDYNDKNLRLLGVDSITLLENNENVVTVEVVGLSYVTPRYKQTLYGKLTRDKDGSWDIDNISESYSPKKLDSGL